MSGIVEPILAGSSSFIILPFTGSGAGAFFINASSGTYQTVAKFLYAGTDITGIPTKIKVLSRTSNGSGNYSVKIFDVTNSMDIAEITAQTNDVFATVDLGTLSNLPAAEAEFEIQMLRGSPGEAQLSSLTIEF